MTSPAAFATMLPSSASAELRAMAEAAWRAGQLLEHAFSRRDGLKLTEKTAGDFVSEADKAAEAEIAACLTVAFPHYGWLGEETGSRKGANTDLCWVVDPLDGTTNFVKGIPHWAISIALCRGAEVLAGLIYDPNKAELFTAAQGKGAHLNGAPIVVSPQTNLQAALFATGLPAGGRITYLQAALDDLGRLMPRCAGIRRGGAAALDLAYVAAGRVDGYWERNLGAWDIAAGVLLVREAGGVVDRLWPDQSILTSGSFIASNKAFVSDLRECIR